MKRIKWMYIGLVTLISCSKATIDMPSKQMASTRNELVNNALVAFPGADGYGKFATGGRGGTVYYVTNLNNAGPGSLRDAVSQPNRTVLFKVSGTIFLESNLFIAQNNITIAGQSAPGDGICIAGYGTAIRANNIIIRYLRFRLGDINGITTDALYTSLPAAGGTPYANIIIDHCSLSWSVDEIGSFYGITDFSLQWCILSESLYKSAHEKGTHGYGGIWGGNRSSFHHNLLAHNSSRNPRFSGTLAATGPDEELVDFRNNVIYNWGNINSTYGGENGDYNMVNNYYKYGPATPGSTVSSISNKRNRILQYTSYSLSAGDTIWGGRFFIQGNFVDGFPDVSADNWTKGVQRDSYAGAAALIAAAKQSTPFPTLPILTGTAEEAYQEVLNQVGAVLPKRDTVDKRIIQEVRNKTATYEGATYALVNTTGIQHPSGIIDSQQDVGGWPMLQSATPPDDSDEDGIPDTWEVDYQLNPNDPSDGNQLADDGYTMLEKYLHSI